MSIREHTHQSGAATLFTSLTLLFLVSLVSVFAAKNVLVSGKISGDHYRASQAAFAADAAMQEALSYFVFDGFDHDGDNVPDFVKDGDVEYVAGSESCDLTGQDDDDMSFVYEVGEEEIQKTYGRYYFDGTPSTENTCSKSFDVSRGMIVAYGWSDDCSAMKKVTVCVTDIDLFAQTRGPRQPFVSKSGNTAAGNAVIINRYNNTTIWSGGPLGTMGAAFGTYLRPPNTELADFTQNELMDANETLNAIEASDRNSGNGLDIITNDQALANLTSDEFFHVFFSSTKDDLQEFAEAQGQLGVDPVGKSGIIWWNGDLSLGGGDQIGSDDDPAVLIVDGNLSIGGDSVIYGIAYTTGQLSLAGTAYIFGSVVSENDSDQGAVSGTPNIVYVPWGDSSVPGMSGFFMGGSAVPGSWRDWE